MKRVHSTLFIFQVSKDPNNSNKTYNSLPFTLDELDLSKLGNSVETEVVKELETEVTNDLKTEVEQELETTESLITK